MTEAELQALAAQHGGEKGRYVYPGDEKVPRVVQTETGSMTIPGLEDINPEPRYIVEFGDGRRAVIKPRLSAPDQYDVIDMPAAPSAAVIGPKADIYNLPGRGLVRLTPEGGAVPVPGGGVAPTAATGSWQNGVYYGGPDAQMPEMLGYDPFALAERQANAQRQAAQDQAAAQRAATTEQRQGYEFQLKLIEEGRRAGEYDDKRAQELRDYIWKTEVELPQKLREQEDARLAAGIERGRHAGEAAVSDITATLPYRYSPGFTARQQAVGAEAARGNFQPGIYQSIARAYRGPDLQGARGAAERGYENQYLQQFGFDPLETAGQVGYRAPGPAAAPLAGLGDDEDEIKRLAAQLAGR